MFVIKNVIKYPVKAASFEERKENVHEEMKVSFVGILTDTLFRCS